MDRNTRMLKTTLIYFIGNFGSKILSFFLLPIYTYWLNPEQFGEIDLLLNIIPLIGPIFTLQATEVIFRFLFECKTLDEKKENITNAFFIFIFGFFVFLVIYLPYSIITNFKYTFLFGMYFFVLYLGIFIQQIMRGLKKNISYSFTGIISTLVYGIVNILLIKTMKEKSLLIAPILASTLVFIFGIYSTKFLSYINLKMINLKVIKKQLNYSLPLVPNQICWWFNGVVGKYIINYYIGISANGILAVATRFPNLLSTIMQIYLLAWTENSICEYKSSDKDEYYSKNLNNLMEFLLFGISGILIIIKIYFSYYINENYLKAFNLIPFLLIAMFFNCTSTFLGSIYTASQNTKGAFYTTIYAAFFNVLFSFLLIPKYGLLGYTFANIISYILFFFIRYKDIKKISNIKLKIPSILAIISFIISIISYFVLSVTFSIIIFIIIIILFTVNYKKLVLFTVKKIIDLLKVKH